MTGGPLDLLRRPAQQARLVAEPSLIPSAVEEMLRFISPIQNMNRTALRDAELHGQNTRPLNRPFVAEKPVAAAVRLRRCAGWRLALRGYAASL